MSGWRKKRKPTKERPGRQPGTYWWLVQHRKMLLREQVRAKTLFAKAEQEYREAESAYIRFPSQSLNTAELSLAKNKRDSAKRNLEYQHEKWEFLNTKGVAIRDQARPHELGARELEWNQALNNEMHAKDKAKEDAAAASATHKNTIHTKNSSAHPGMNECVDVQVLTQLLQGGCCGKP